MNINDAFPSNYLKSSDLGETEPVVTISHIELEAIGKNKDQKPVMYFSGKKKGLVLNVTNSKRITTLIGSADTDDWIGKQIRLYATETEFAGETVECIRIKAASGKKPVTKQATPKVAVKSAPVDDEDLDTSFDQESDEVPF